MIKEWRSLNLRMMSLTKWLHPLMMLSLMMSEGYVVEEEELALVALPAQPHSLVGFALLKAMVVKLRRADTLSVRSIVTGKEMSTASTRGEGIK
jgi:hypothetical protein